MRFKEGDRVLDFCFKKTGKVFFVEKKDIDYYGAVMVRFSNIPGSEDYEYFKTGKNLYGDISLCKGFFCMLKFLFFVVFRIRCG